MKSGYTIVSIGVLLLILTTTLVTAASDQLDNAGTLYSKSVDLANEGKYQEALVAADEALARNMSSLIPLIQANRAGILVMLGHYEDAITAADAALSSSGNLTTAFSVAYYNKGDALRHLGRIDEARIAFSKAQDLDPSLIPPDVSIPLATAVPAPTKSPLSGITILAGFAGACAVYLCFRPKI
jgi:tetratricopeptide (TPR) repeat protein